MSASCQFVNSMFEVRPIGTRTKFKPVKIPGEIFLDKDFCKRNVISE